MPTVHAMRAGLVQRWSAAVSKLPGALVCGVIALAATFVSEHYGGPQLLYALLMGLAFHFLMDNAQVRRGVEFCGRSVLRLGVALLGVRITLHEVFALGAATALTLVSAVALTLACGLALAHRMKRPREEGLLSGGAVAICGASAALAIASVLPKTAENERFTLLAVVGVTVLSTVSMVLYPFALQMLGLSQTQSGIFLGGTIHDVAQVVAAGMLVGPQAGDTATVVKLFRLTLLMPVVLAVALLYRGHADVGAAVRPPLFPRFLLGFIALVLLGSIGTFNTVMVQTASDASRWMLVVAIAAAGLKTSFGDLLKLGWLPVFMLLTETVFIASFVLFFVVLFGLGVD